MKKFYILFFFIPFLFHPQLRAQGRFEIFGLEACSAPNKNYNFNYFGFGLSQLSDTTTFHFKKNLHDPKFQFGAGFSFGRFGFKTIDGIPILPHQQLCTGRTSIENRAATIFGDMRCIFSTSPQSEISPYIDFFAGQRFLKSRMIVNSIGVDGIENRSVISPGKASGLLLGVGVGINFQIEFFETPIFFTSELMWNYSPIHGTIANASTLQHGASGIGVDVTDASNNILMLKLGFSFGNFRKSCNRINHYKNTATTPYVPVRRKNKAGRDMEPLNPYFYSSGCPGGYNDRMQTVNTK